MICITLVTIYGNRLFEVSKQSPTSPAIQEVLSIGTELMIYLIQQTELRNEK
ncbi:MAG: hypothetical protein K2W99_05815 [Chthoniobacterales bacterium]|nr:hypothetical protein [Chthoniobacterales bacterium]